MPIIVNLDAICKVLYLDYQLGDILGYKND